MDHPLGHYLRAQNNYVTRKLLRSRVSWKLSEDRRARNWKTLQLDDKDILKRRHGLVDRGGEN